jgi:O-antigen ligase
MRHRMSSAAYPDRKTGPCCFAALLIGLVPLAMVLLPWDFGSEMTTYRGFMRGTSSSVTIMQALVAVFAFSKGFKIIPALISLPDSIKIGLMLFWATCVISAVTVAPLPALSSLGMLQLVMHLLFVLSLIHLLSAASSGVHCDIWNAVGWGIIGYAILCLANIILYHPQRNDWVWFVPALTNIRWIGFFALAGFCSGLGALVVSPTGRIERRQIALSLLFCTLSCFLALWTASRGAVLAIIIASAFAIYARKDRKALVTIILLASMTATAVAAALPVPHYLYGIDRLFGSAVTANDVNSFSSGRVLLWTETIEKIVIRPAIGWGIDQFRFAGPEATLGLRHPHQSILQLLFATGAVGALALVLIAIPLLRCLPITVASSSQTAAGSYLVAGTAYGLYDGFFYYAYPVMVYLAAIALLVKPQFAPPANDRSGLPSPISEGRVTR